MSQRSVEAMHVATTRRVDKDRVYTAHLLRPTYRQGGKVQHRTPADLSALPEPIVERIRRALRGEPFIAASGELKVVASWLHGAVWAVWSVLRHVGLDRLLAGEQGWRAIVPGMVMARLVNPGSKRFTADPSDKRQVVPMVTEIGQNLGC